MKTKTLLLSLLFCSTFLRAQVPNYVPLSGLQAYWPFSGNADDQGINAYADTVYGAALCPDRFGNSNAAYSFNGTTDYISTGYAGILGSNPRAVSFWAKSAQMYPTVMGCVGWGSNLQNSRFECAFNYAATGATFGSSYGALTYSTPTNVYDNNWHHYVFQFSDSLINQVRIYQDTVLLTQLAATYLPNGPLNTLPGFNVTFGKVIYTPSPDYLNGQLDDIGIWDRLLSLCEIKQLFTASSSTSSLSITVSSSNSVICPGQPITLTAAGATSYTWSTLSSSGSIVVSPSITTTYSVSGQVLGACSSAASITASVTICAGIDASNMALSDLIVYPNPTSGELTLESLGTHAYIQVYDAIGQLILSKKADEQTRIDLSTQSKGVYFLKVETGNGFVNRKVIKE